MKGQFLDVNLKYGNKMKNEKLNLFFFWRKILPIVEEISFCLVACYRFLKNTGRKKWKNSAIVLFK